MASDLEAEITGDDAFVIRATGTPFDAVIRQPRAVCAIHGEHDRQKLHVALDINAEYPFCPYCWGEFMQRTFPVTAK